MLAGQKVPPITEMPKYPVGVTVVAEGITLLASITELIGLSVYTEDSIHVGTVSDVIIDTEKYCVDSVYIEKPNPLMVEGSIAIGVPFRWIGAVGDIILLRHFPRYIRTGGKREERVKKMRKLADTEVDEVA